MGPLIQALAKLWSSPPALVAGVILTAFTAAIAIIASGRGPDEPVIVHPDLNSKDRQAVEPRAWAQKREMEIRLSQQVEDALESIVGRSNVRVTVQAEMDNSQAAVGAQAFDDGGQLPRSSRMATEGAQSTQTKGGNPGTAARSLPDAPAGITTGASSYSSALRSEETTSSEISRTNAAVLRELGEIRRLSVAVVVNGIWQPDGTYTPRTEKQMEVFQQIVERAVGARVERGDEVRVVNEPFPRNGTER